MTQMIKGYLALGLAVAVVALLGCAGESVDILLEKSGAAVQDGRWQEALTYSDRVLGQDADNLGAAVFKGISLHALQRSADAVDVLRNAAEKHPDNFAAQYFYGWILWENQRFADALTPLKRAYAQRSRHPDLLILLSRCCLQQNLKEGMRYLQSLRQFRRYRERPEVYNSIAILWFGQQEYERAQESFLRALDKAPQNAVILQNLAVLNDQYLQDPERALYYYRHALAQSQKINDRERARIIVARLQQLARERAAGG